MITFWEKYKIRIMGAILGALFHLALIGIVVGGEGQIFLILVFMDFPITLIWSLLFGVVGTGGTPMVITYFIGGTLMYAILGWLAGGLCCGNNNAYLKTGN
jgi:hypothetical protein